MTAKSFPENLLPAVLLSFLFAAVVGCAPSAEESPSEKPPEARRSSAAASFPFTDMTDASGVDVIHQNGATEARYFPETMAPGVALFDADGDGDLDLYAVNGSRLDGRTAADEGGPEGANRLFLNRGDATFEEAPEAGGAGDRGYGQGVATGDVDGDGDLDLYVLNYGPNALYLNDGAGHFEKAPPGAFDGGVDGAGGSDASWSVAGAFLDADADGDLDLWVVNYLEYDHRTAEPCRAGSLTIYCSPEPFEPAVDRLYLNEGVHDGALRFVDATAAAGLLPGRGMGIAIGDFNADGRQDVVVANDKSQNQLYASTGSSGFEEIGAEVGIGYGTTGEVEGGMGVVAGDFLGDGRSAIFQTNFQKEPNRFFVVAGEPEREPGADFFFFDDRTLTSGLGFPSQEAVSWGIGKLDVEGDGDLDLVVANGHVFDNAGEFIPGSAYRMPDHLFLNDGAGRFSAREFPGRPLSSRGVAVGDLDGDGDEDLVIASCGDRLRLWRNDAGRPERFVVVRLAGRAPNTRGVGARLVAEVGGRRLVREVAGGGSYASQGSDEIVLGLDEASAIDRLTLRWGDGSIEEAGPVDGGQTVVWRQGEGIVERKEHGDV